MTTAAVVVACLASIPLAYLVVRLTSAEGAQVREALFRAKTLELLVNTSGLVLAVSAACLVLGVTTAWLVVRTNLPCRKGWLVASALPLAIPSYVAAFGWVSLSDLRGFWGAWLVLTLGNSPLVTLPVVAALRQANLTGEDVARTLGRSRATAFASATWPQIRPAAMAGVLLVALYTLGDFGGVSLMRFQAFTWAVHSAYGALFDRTLAAVLATVLALMGIALVVAERRARGARTARGIVVEARSTPVPITLGRWRWPALAALAGVAVASLGVPLLALVRGLAQRAESAIQVSAGDVLRDLGHTVGFAGAGTLVAVALALPVGYVAARRRGMTARVVESASYLGLALPGIVVGLSLVFFGLTVVPGLYQTAIMMAFAYGVLFLPRALGAVRSSLEQVEPGIEEVARTLGSSPSGVWRRVTSRIAWPGIAAGSLLVAISAMKELPATLMLRPTGSDTLATSLWRLTEASAYGAAAPYALALVIVAAVPAVFLTREALRGPSRSPRQWVAT